MRLWTNSLLIFALLATAALVAGCDNAPFGSLKAEYVTHEGETAVDAGSQSNDVVDTPDAQSPEPTDEDGDGVTADVDCNDNNAAIHSGAVEQCNGVDDDCDGLVDENLWKSWWVDADKDGFGSGICFKIMCHGQAGPNMVDNDTDCNDAIKTVHPGATEQCNGVDDDCDGLVDENVSLILFLDVDGDGYGDPGAWFSGCGAGDDLVVNDTDCDDVKGDVHPGAVEQCNGVDDDCDGLVDEIMAGMCDDDSKFTVDTCDPILGMCQHEDILVEFVCSLPDSAASDLVCGSGVFFEKNGQYGEKIVQKLGGLLELTAADVCWELGLGSLLHLNTYALDPADPFAIWTGGEYTKVTVQGMAVSGSPGTVTLFPFGLDTLYDQADFQICQP